MQEPQYLSHHTIQAHLRNPKLRSYTAARLLYAMPGKRSMGGRWERQRDTLHVRFKLQVYLLQFTLRCTSLSRLMNAHFNYCKRGALCMHLHIVILR